MGATPDKGYKRSWKNLLINKRYQLRFTLFMVGLSTLLMLGLGYWVLNEASDATAVARNKIEDRQCEPKGAQGQPSVAPPQSSPEPTPEPISDGADKVVEPEPAEGFAGAPAELGVDETATVREEATGKAAPAAGVTEGSDTVAGAPTEPGVEARPTRKIEVELGEMKLDPTVLENEAAQGEIAPVLTPMDLARCRKEKDTQLTDLDVGYVRIKAVLIAVGLLLILGLTIFGIKMTHKVAGPLYKVTLYFEKMREGTYDEVYSLRKGDQLIEFYEHFKAAHTGLKGMEQADIEILRDVLEAANKADLATRSPELAALLDELRETLKRKEKSLA